MNVLVLAPHPDDEAIGCGGSLYLHAEKGDRASVVFLTSGELGLKKFPREKAWAIRESEAGKAAKILGLSQIEFLRGPDWTLADSIPNLTKPLAQLLTAIQPQLIYLPHPDDGHPDHGAALPLLRAALAFSAIPIPDLRGYEIWTPLRKFDYVEDITGVLPRKLRALRAHQSQLQEFDYARAVKGLNAFRGALAGKCRYAEVFQDLPL